MIVVQLKRHDHYSPNTYCIAAADLAAVDDLGATAWDYARARQLHYCMLIIASYIRERAKNHPEEENSSHYPGMDDSVNGMNGLQVNAT